MSCSLAPCFECSKALYKPDQVAPRRGDGAPGPASTACPGPASTACPGPVSAADGRGACAGCAASGSACVRIPRPLRNQWLAYRSAYLAYQRAPNSTREERVAEAALFEAEVAAHAAYRRARAAYTRRTSTRTAAARSARAGGAAAAGTMVLAPNAWLRAAIRNFLAVQASQATALNQANDETNSPFSYPEELPSSDEDED